MQQRPVEVHFLQLMACVEAMDEVFVLCEKTTAALLGTSPAAAKLLNCMRNKLIHGAGGYLEAFTEVLKKNFKGSLPQLGPGFDDVVIVRDELQFTQLWLRLCERLDAFWCGYLKVDPDLLMHRSTWADIALLPAVKMDSFAQLVEQLKENKKRDEQARKEKVAQEKLLQEKVDLERGFQSCLITRSSARGQVSKITWTRSQSTWTAASDPLLPFKVLAKWS